jgi:hypothetical protein
MTTGIYDHIQIDTPAHTPLQSLSHVVQNTFAPKLAEQAPKPEKKSVLQRVLGLNLPSPSVQLHTQTDPQRDEIKHYVARQFSQYYQADIHHYLPLFVSMQCEIAHRKSLSAVAGLRCAAQSNLFVESYLKDSIEDTLADLNQNAGPLQRHQIVEIGNLVATQRGASQLLFIILCGLLYQANLPGVVFTATPQVEKLLKKLGFELHFIVKAEADKLQDGGKDWGSYYQTQPNVFFCDARQAMTQIRQSRFLKPIYHSFEDNIAVLVDQLHQVNSEPNKNKTNSHQEGQA